jgi:hypothetical protein
MEFEFFNMVDNDGGMDDIDEDLLPTGNENTGNYFFVLSGLAHLLALCTTFNLTPTPTILT